MAFWSILVSSDKPYTFTPVFDLKITQLVLPAAATHKDRTVLECTFDDQTFALGSLKLDVQENITTDILVDESKPVTFSTKGSNPVQVIGYYMVDREDDLDDLSDDDDLEGFEGLEGLEGDEEDDEEGDEMDDGEDQEIDEEDIKQATLQALNNKRKQQHPGQQNGGAKKVKIDDGEAKPQEQKEKTEKPQQPKPQNQKNQNQKQKQQKGEQAKEQEEAKVEAKVEDEQAADQKKQGGQQQQKQQKQQQKGGQQQQQKGGEQGTPKQNKQQQQQKGQTPKAENAPQSAQKVESESKGEPEQETKMVSGMKVIITKPGQGTAEAKRGKAVRVMYVGRLSNGKVFDQSSSPFEFSLGKGQVIKGWDLGVEGMRIGEQRTLIIPPELAYGKKGSGSVIPKNATLRFDVKMVKF